MPAVAVREHDRGLGEQASRFREQRAVETGAPERLQRLRDRIGETGRRIEAAARRRDARRETLDAPALGALFLSLTP